MSRELSDVLPDLEPPPGGLAGLRARLERPRRWPVAVVALAAAVLLAVAFQPERRPLPQDPVLLAMLQPPSEPATVVPEARGRLAMERVAVGSAGVVYYRVGGVGRGE